MHYFSGSFSLFKQLRIQLLIEYRQFRTRQVVFVINIYFFVAKTSQLTRNELGDVDGAVVADVRVVDAARDGEAKPGAAAIQVDLLKLVTVLDERAGKAAGGAGRRSPRSHRLEFRHPVIHDVARRRRSSPGYPCAPEGPVANLPPER